MEERLIWTDIETFGLNPNTDPIVEVGFRITDLNLHTLHEFQALIWNHANDKRWEKEKADSTFVYKMHDTSGLWQEAHEEGRNAHEVEADLIAWLEGHGIKDRKEPLCGSTVSFDRSMLVVQMPAVEELFHYRDINVSSVKELCKRYNPEVYAKLDETTKPQKLHRVLPDLYDTISEFAFYRDNFLFEGN